MKVDGIGPNQKTQSPTTNTQPTLKFATTTQYDSTIRFGKDSFADKAKSTFWKGWEKMQDLFHTLVDWVKWVFSGCPGERSKFIEEIIADPEGQSKIFAKDPVESGAEIALGALLDPKGVKELRDKNKGKVGEFVKAVKKEGKNNDDLKFLFDGQSNGILQALWAAINPFAHSGHDVYKDLAAWVGENPSILAPGLEGLAKKVLANIGEEDKEKDTEEVKALRLIFKDYIPQVAKELKENPEGLEAFFKKIYSLKGLDLPKIIEALATLGTRVSPKENEALNLILKDQALTLQKLSDPKTLGSDYKALNPIDVRMVFYKEVIKALDPDLIKQVIEKIGKKYPLMTTLLGNIQDLGKSGLKKVAANLPKGIEVLKQLREDYKNPPSK